MSFSGRRIKASLWRFPLRSCSPQNTGENLITVLTARKGKITAKAAIWWGINCRRATAFLSLKTLSPQGQQFVKLFLLLLETEGVHVEGLVVSVDRMERGSGEKTAIQELYEDFGIRTYPIVTVREIIDTLYNVEIDGKIVIDDQVRVKMEIYLEKYCVKPL